MALVNPLLVESAIESRLRLGGLPVRVRVEPSETHPNFPVNKYEVWVRYYESSYTPIESASGAITQYWRKMGFHILTKVEDLRNHATSLTIHNSAIGLLTGWLPVIGLPLGTPDLSCEDGNVAIQSPGVIVESDKFERYYDGAWAYRINYFLITEHSGISSNAASIPNIVVNSLEPGIFLDKPGFIGDTSTKDKDFQINNPT